MIDSYYPVFQVTDSGIDPEDEPERLGSKRKFWFRREDGVRCLFKFPRRDFGEQWAELDFAQKLDGVSWPDPTSQERPSGRYSIPSPAARPG